MIIMLKIEHEFKTPIYSDHYQIDQLNYNTEELDRSQIADIEHISQQTTNNK